MEEKLSVHLVGITLVYHDALREIKGEHRRVALRKTLNINNGNKIKLYSPKQHVSKFN